MPWKHRVLPWVAMGLFFLVDHEGSQACQICLPFPTESLADRILESEHLVLARENPEKPFTLRAIRSLKQGDAEPPPLDLFLDTSSRRQLARNEDLAILCGWKTGDSDWRRLSLHDEVVGPVVAEILARMDEWRAIPDGTISAERVRFFAEFLDDDDGRLADLAHIEVARAPYGHLKQYGNRIPREELLERLADFRRMEWHALYILFLAQSEVAEDRERIREEIAEAAEFRLVTRTAAWATAFLELDGSQAVERLRDWYGKGSDRRSGERQAVLAALVVHADQGDPALRDPIVDLLGEFLQAEPDLAPEIVTNLANWGCDDLFGPVAALLRDSPERFDTDATLALRRYLREAEKPREEGKTEAESAPSRAPLFALVGFVFVALCLGLGERRRGEPVAEP